MKKFFGMLVCMLLALGLVPNLAFATGENEAKIGDTEYATLQEALEHVQAGETVTLLKDVTTNNVTQKLTTDMTLDLGGFTLTNIGGTVFNLYANLTLQNGKVAMTEANNRPTYTLPLTRKSPQTIPWLARAGRLACGAIVTALFSPWTESWVAKLASP